MNAQGYLEAAYELMGAHPELNMDQAIQLLKVEVLDLQAEHLQLINDHTRIMAGVKLHGQG